MENPFKDIAPKDWLYIGGALASLAALAWVFGRGNVVAGNGTQTDVPQSAVTSVPGYTNYNFPPLNPVPLTTPAQDEAAANGNCCCTVNGCGGPSQLDDGSAYSSLNGLLAYYQNTNPQYEKLYATQLATYADYFSKGETYSRAGVSLGVSNLPVSNN